MQVNTKESKIKIGKEIFLKLLIFLFIIAVICIAAPMAWKFSSTNIFAKSPVIISRESVVNILHSEQVLNVLEEMNRATYQVRDPGTYQIFGKEFKIPGREKVVTVKYDYTVHWGYDLYSLSGDDVNINGNAINIRLHKPEITSIEISNDHAQTDGGFLVSKKNPMDDAVRMDESHDDYTNILQDNAKKELKESGKFIELQQVAMDRTNNQINDLIRTITSEDLNVNIEFY